MLKSMPSPMDNPGVAFTLEAVEPLKSDAYTLPLPYGQKDASIVAMLENARVSSAAVLACKQFTSRLILLPEYNARMDAVDAEAGLIHLNYFKD